MFEYLFFKVSTSDTHKSEEYLNEKAIEDWEFVPLGLIGRDFYFLGKRSTVKSVAVGPETKKVVRRKKSS